METKLDVLINLFVATKQTEGRSVNTILWYRRMLGRFSGYLPGSTVKDFTLANARAFVAHLQQMAVRYERHPLSPPKVGGLSPASIHGYVRTLKTFSAWLHEEGFTREDALAKLKRPKLPETLIEVLSESEIQALFNGLNPNTYLGNRLYTILMLLLDTGIRASELCTLTTHNLDLVDGKIKVTGKGNKERIVPFGANTKKALLRHVSAWRPVSESDRVFLDLAGGPLSYNNLIHGMKKLGTRVGVQRLHPHLCRHTFAVKFLMNGGDLMSLKMLLGHTSIEVTQRYLHLTEGHLTARYSQFSPMDRMDIKKKRAVPVPGRVG
ncbi:MAG: tyrosine-type recombinase/integrase [Chloroflexi bacterium]|nr:tyrosine-type recombinase/integrase [Chloroflexota bacterium]